MMSKLKRLADDLIAECLRHPGESRERNLGGGVVLRMKVDESEFSLLVIRPRVYASDSEMKVFRNVFEVPQDVFEKTPGQFKRHTDRGDVLFFYRWFVWQIPTKYKKVAPPQLTLAEKEFAKIVPTLEQI